LRSRLGQRVLEVGCGTGDEARRLRRQVGEHGSVTAIDISEHMLCEAKARDARALADAFSAG